MKSGIIGLPQVGKTALFTILTQQTAAAHANPREIHLGMATVPDSRLDKLADLYQPRKLIHATIEYADVAAMSQEALKEAALLNTLRTVDSLTHVVRAFEDPAIPHVGGIDPLRIFAMWNST
jgi:ribosome-binding ATPase YchF (GTP1/OBG family)